MTRWQIKRKLKRMFNREVAIQRELALREHVEPGLVEVWAWAKACENLTHDFMVAFDAFKELAHIQSSAEEARIRAMNR